MDNKTFLILLADDDKDDCHLFENALRELPLSTQLTIVYDGEQLMQQITNKNIIPPDVLFLDINMPRKNGLECLKEIRLNKKLKQLPVIIFSTSAEKELVILLYKTGAQYFIRKPDNFSDLKMLLYHTVTMLAENAPPGEGGTSVKPSIDKFMLNDDVDKPL